MEFLLVVVAAVSLALAAIMSTVAWRLLRDDKLRTTNRAEALIALLHGGEKPQPEADAVITPAVVSSNQPAPAPGPLVHADEPAQAVASARPVAESRSEAVSESGAEPQPPAELKRPFNLPSKIETHRASAVEDAPLRTEPIRRIEDESATWDRTDVGRGLNRTTTAEAALADAMFTSDEPRQMSMGRWLGLAAAGLVILIGAGTVYALNSGTWLSSVMGSANREGMVAASAQQPLELLSLRHTVDETGAFVVTGLVQNPAEGVALRDVVATVYLFDLQGRYFASGRARLDVPSLSAGEESPFVVKIPKTAGVGRYRVGFRLDDGGVVAHVDRRGQTPAGTSGDTIDDPGGSVVTPAATPRRSEG